MVIQVITTNWLLLLIGLLFIVIGIVVRKYKLYWLIAGLNGLPEKELKRFNVRFIEKYFGIFMIVLGLLTIVNPFLLTALHRQENIMSTFSSVTLGTVALMFVFGGMNRRRICNS